MRHTWWRLLCLCFLRGIDRAYYASRHLLSSDEDVAGALLDEANVAVVHGSAFGLAPYIRIAYALGDAPLRAACEAIQRFSQALAD